MITATIILTAITIYIITLYRYKHKQDEQNRLDTIESRRLQALQEPRVASEYHPIRVVRTFKPRKKKDKSLTLVKRKTA